VISSKSQEPFSTFSLWIRYLKPSPGEVLTGIRSLADYPS